MKNLCYSFAISSILLASNSFAGVTEGEKLMSSAGVGLAVLTSGPESMSFYGLSSFCYASVLGSQSNIAKIQMNILQQERAEYTLTGVDSAFTSQIKNQCLSECTTLEALDAAIEQLSSIAQ